MPVTVRKKDGYQVRTPGGVKAKGTTFQKAQAQAALLRGIEHGWTPTGKPARKYRGGNALRRAAKGSSPAVLREAKRKTKKRAVA